jgi:outer membrane biosynthesis protein TonB
VKILQRSGIATLDLSVERAIREAAPFPALPAGFDKDTATVEFWFELKR